MYPINPGLAGPLTQERVSELRRQAAARRRQAPTSLRLRRLRNATGLALVTVGLRIAVPRSSALPSAR